MMFFPYLISNISGERGGGLPTESTVPESAEDWVFAGPPGIPDPAVRPGTVRLCELPGSGSFLYDKTLWVMIQDLIQTLLVHANEEQRGSGHPRTKSYPVPVEKAPKIWCKETENKGLAGMRAPSRASFLWEKRRGFGAKKRKTKG